MNDVFICGAGLQSCQGNSLEAALLSLSTHAVGPARVDLPSGLSRPYHLMPGGLEMALAGMDGASWRARVTGSAHRVIEASLGPRLPGAARPALYVASSSLDLGGEPPGAKHAAPLSEFARRMAMAEGWAEAPVVVNTACTSAFNALNMAWGQIARGQADEALVLGIETFNLFALLGFESMQLLAPQRAEPLGVDRQGMVLGEAVAALRLSKHPPAEGTAAAIGVWRILGYANVADGASPTGATEGALVEACERALHDAGLNERDVDLIKLQAAGSPTNDAVEVAALRRVFQVLPPCVSFKAVLGHTLGASCAAETAMLLACLEHDVWPPMDHTVEPDMEALMVSSRRPLEASTVQTVLLVGLGFGGGHSVLVLRRHRA